MPTNEKSEKKCTICYSQVNGLHLSSWPCPCACHVIKKVLPDKLAEAQKLLENIDKDLCLLLKGNYSCARVWEAWQYGTMKEEDFAPLEEDENIINDFQNFISKLLSAQDLISYERGREEQRKIDAEIAKEICSDSDCCGPEIYQKIINPSPDAK